MNDSTWTWISGSSTSKQPGVYGEKGVPSPDNHPSARQFATGCYDHIAQEFWLFGCLVNPKAAGLFMLTHTTISITHHLSHRIYCQ